MLRRTRLRTILASGAALVLVSTTGALLSSAPSGGTAPPAAGSVIAWGYNQQGYLGNGSTTNSLTAVQPTFPAGTVITSISASHFATYAITSTGSVYAWGKNVDGQLGIGSNTGPQSCSATPCSESPVLVHFPAGTVVTQVAAGHNFAVAVTSAGAVYSWGYNAHTDLGNGTTNEGDTPALVSLPPKTFVTAVAAGHDTGYALTSFGTVLAWGDNSDGELGIGNNTGPTNCSAHPCSMTPMPVDLPEGITATGLAAESNNGLVLTSTGGAYGWGLNSEGEAGIGSDTSTGGCVTAVSATTPLPVQLPAGVVATGVVGGHFNGLVTTTTGSVYAWGDNFDGELGNGNDTGPNTCTGGDPCARAPVLSQLPGGVKATQVAASGYSVLALTSTGAVYGWGYNGDGQLGLGTATGPDSCGGAPCSWTPVTVTNVPSGADIIGVAEGNYFSLLLTAPPQAYDLVGSDGGVFVFPTGQPTGFFGSLPGLHVSVNNVVGIVPTNNFTGYDLVGSDGGVFVFPTGLPLGFFGSLPGLHVSVNNVVGIVPTNHGTGYDLVGSDGGVFVFPTGQPFGFFGSLPGLHVSVNDIAGIVGAPGGTGYFLVGRDGGVFTFGRAPFLGSLPGEHISVNDITGIAATPDGRGYYVVGADGAVFAFGDATPYGSVTSQVNDIKSIVVTPDGRGYWLIGADGSVYPFGSAVSQGSLPGIHVNVSNIVGAVPTI